MRRARAPPTPFARYGGSNDWMQVWMTAADVRVAPVPVAPAISPGSLRG